VSHGIQSFKDRSRLVLHLAMRMYVCLCVSVRYQP
jgi:hypothetical protein